MTPFNIDHAFYRDTCGKAGSITTDGPCPRDGHPKDTDNNAADFIFVASKIVANTFFPECQTPVSISTEY